MLSPEEAAGASVLSAYLLAHPSIPHVPRFQARERPRPAASLDLAALVDKMVSGASDWSSRGDSRLPLRPVISGVGGLLPGCRHGWARALARFVYRIC